MFAAGKFIVGGIVAAPPGTGSTDPPSIATSERGLWAIKWSFAGLAATAVIQLLVVFLSGSVALLADMAGYAPYLSDECLVAIDAPLIVNNPTGHRPCEAALNRDFRRFDAEARPAYADMPEFKDPRGARIADTRGNEHDRRAERAANPDSGEQR